MSQADVERTLASLDDEELLRIVAIDAESYESFAVEFAREELTRRGRTEQTVTAYEAVSGERQAKSAYYKRATLPTLRRGFLLSSLVTAAMVALALPGEGASDDATEVRGIAGLLTGVFFIWAVVHWLNCVSRIHKVLEQETNGTYSVSSLKAVVLHFVPFYGYYWIRCWPNKIAEFIRERAPRIDPPPRSIGVMFLLAALLSSCLPPVGLLLQFACLKPLVASLRRWQQQRAEEGA